MRIGVGLDSTRVLTGICLSIKIRSFKDLGSKTGCSLIEGELCLLEGLVPRGDKIVLVEQVRGRLLLRLSGVLLLRSSEGFMKRPG